jgi:hypothetical protein
LQAFCKEFTHKTSIEDNNFWSTPPSFRNLATSGLTALSSLKKGPAAATIYNASAVRIIEEEPPWLK